MVRQAWEIGEFEKMMGGGRGDWGEDWETYVVRPVVEDVLVEVCCGVCSRM